MIVNQKENEQIFTPNATKTCPNSVCCLARVASNSGISSADGRNKRKTHTNTLKRDCVCDQMTYECCHLDDLRLFETHSEAIFRKLGFKIGE